MSDLRPEWMTDEVLATAAKALFAIEEPDRNAWRWDRENPADPDGPLAWHQYWMDAARVVLEAVVPDLLRQAKAEAWDEGYTSGFYDREQLTGDSRDASEGRTGNPYRADQIAGAES